MEGEGSPNPNRVKVAQVQRGLMDKTLHMFILDDSLLAKRYSNSKTEERYIYRERERIVQTLTERRGLAWATPVSH